MIDDSNCHPSRKFEVCRRERRDGDEFYVAVVVISFRELNAHSKVDYQGPKIILLELSVAHVGCLTHVSIEATHNTKAR